jgi:hypothetical protein
MGTALHLVSKAQSKYILKGKVFSSSLNKVSVPSESSVIVSNQSSTGSSAIELEVGNICDKEKEKDVGSEDSKFLSSSSKVEILKEEEVIEISSSFEESQEEESSSFSELELEKVLEVAPYVNREISTEEDIKGVLNLLHQNPKIQSVIRSHQDLTSSFQNLSIESPTPYHIQKTPKNHPVFNLPDHLARKTRYDISQILQESIPDCISSDRSENSSSCVKVFGNPLFLEDKPKAYKQFDYFVAHQNLKAT